MLHIEVIAQWTSYRGTYYFPSLESDNNLIGVCFIEHSLSTSTHFPTEYKSIPNSGLLQNRAQELYPLFNLRRGDIVTRIP